MDIYINWLKEKKQPLYEIDGTYWRPYQKALVPASVKPEPVRLTLEQEHELLRRSGALFLRYFTRTVSHPTAFWYTACDQYDASKLHQKVRANIRRGHKNCHVERVDPVWLADNGYPCYASAFLRYRNAQPESKAGFDEMCRGAVGGPFEFWAAFVDGQLSGFAKCVVGGDYAACLVLKLDPNFIRLDIASALKNSILSTYVSQQGKTAYAGFRSVVHDTNTHDFLTRQGYSRVFCDLKLVYRPAIRTAVNLLYKIRPIVDRIPESFMNLKGNVRALLLQEEIRRSIELGGNQTS
jgi:hypothetical protein